MCHSSDKGKAMTMGGRGGVLMPTPEWQGVAVSQLERDEWSNTFTVGEIDPRASVPDEVRKMMRRPARSKEQRTK